MSLTNAAPLGTSNTRLGLPPRDAHDADPRVPGDTHLFEALYALAFGTLSIGVMGALALLAQAPFIFPSLGPTAFLIFHRSTASAASPRNTIMGHFFGVICGLSALAVFGLFDAPSALEAGVTWPRVFATATSLGLTSGLMVWFRCGHPPAGATTLIISLGLLTTLPEVATLMTAVCVLVVQGWVLHRVVGRRSYPLWSQPAGV